MTLSCLNGYDDTFHCHAFYGYLCHVLELVMLFCGIELLCLLPVKLFSRILSDMIISSSAAILVIINTH